MPFSELGRRVGLSAPAVAERLRRMEDAGIVRGYRVLLSPAALGLRLQAYIRMTVRYGQCEHFAAQMHAMPEVLKSRGPRRGAPGSGHQCGQPLRRAGDEHHPVVEGGG